MATALSTHICFAMGIELNLERDYTEAQVKVIRNLACEVIGRTLVAIGGLAEKHTEPCPHVSPDDVVLTMRAAIRKSL